MSAVNKHIDRFNNLHGKTVQKISLVEFHADVVKSKDPNLKVLEEKLSGIIAQVKTKSVKIALRSKLEYPKKALVVAKPSVTDRKSKKRGATPAKQSVSNKVTKEASKKTVERIKPATALAGFTTAKPKGKVRALNGVVDASEIAKMNFTKLPISGEYKTAFGSLYDDTQLMFWGSPGSGKTVWLLKFAQYLASQLKLNVLFLANEELNRSTLTEKIRQFNIGDKNLKFAKDFDALKVSGYKLTDFDAIFFDSIQSLAMDLPAYKKFVKENPGRMYILIIQSTKEGDFRGGKDWEHEVDIAGEIVNRKLILRKNRLDSDFASKAEQQMINHQVEQHKTKKLIQDKVKGTQTPPVVQPVTITA